MTRPAIPEDGNAITADWMHQALTADRTSRFPAMEDITIERIGTGAGLMGEILRCRLNWRGGAPDAPRSVIVKLPTSEPKNLRMSKRLSLYKREYDYYHHLAADAPIRSPTLLYGDFEDRSQRFVLVLEDLRGMETIDQIRGADATTARRAIRAIARLHGRYWSKVDRPPLSGLYDTTDPKRRPLMQVVYLANLAPALERVGSCFPDKMRRLAEAYGPRIADHMSDLAAGSKTLVHGDFRLDNMFFGAGGADDFAVIDWQGSGLGGGLYDVAYFLGGNVPTEIRRAIEREALEEYADIVRSMGASDFTFEECWGLYRQYMLVRLQIPVLVFGGLTLADERSRRRVETGLRRTLAAIEDLDADKLLPGRRPLVSLASAFSAMSAGAYKVLKVLQ